MIVLLYYHCKNLRSNKDVQYIQIPNYSWLYTILDAVPKLGKVVKHSPGILTTTSEYLMMGIIRVLRTYG
jgi:hypothetical protein